MIVDKSPAKPRSEIGPHAMVGSNNGNINVQESMSTECTNPQQVVQKVVHKTPQIKPSVCGLANQTIPDNYSDNDKKNDDFALPLVGKKRRSSNAGLLQQQQAAGINPQKRQHLMQNVSGSNKKEV